MHACSCTMLRITWHYFFSVFQPTLFFKIVRFKEKKMVLKNWYLVKIMLKQHLFIYVVIWWSLSNKIFQGLSCASWKIFFSLCKTSFGLFFFLTFLYISEISLSFDNITTPHVLKLLNKRKNIFQVVRKWKETIDNGW
jgi:hypothetical protein